MKFALALFFAFITIATAGCRNAMADDRRLAILVSDGGTISTSGLRPHVQYSLYCQYESSYKTGNSVSNAAATANDFVIPDGKAIDFCASPARSYLTVFPTDGGTGNCRLFEVDPPTVDCTRRQ